MAKEKNTPEVPQDITAQGQATPATPEVPTFTLSGVAPSGEPVSQAYTISTAKVRLLGGELVDSTALISVANGEQLDASTLSANPSLASLGQAGALSWLTTLVEKGATFVRAVAVLLLALLALPAFSQIGSGYVQNFWTETLTNADTVYFTVGKKATDLVPLEAIWQFSYASTSGTPQVIVQLQERTIINDNAWHVVWADTVKAAKRSLFYTHNVLGTEQRIFVRSVGTQVTRPLATVRYRRKHTYNQP